MAPMKISPRVSGSGLPRSVQPHVARATWRPMSLTRKWTLMPWPCRRSMLARQAPVMAFRAWPIVMGWIGFADVCSTITFRGFSAFRYPYSGSLAAVSKTSL